MYRHPTFVGHRVETRARFDESRDDGWCLGVSRAKVQCRPAVVVRGVGIRPRGNKCGDDLRRTVETRCDMYRHPTVVGHRVETRARFDESRDDGRHLRGLPRHVQCRPAAVVGGVRIRPRGNQRGNHGRRVVFPSGRVVEGRPSVGAGGVGVRPRGNQRGDDLRRTVETRCDMYRHPTFVGHRVETRARFDESRDDGWCLGVSRAKVQCRPAVVVRGVGIRPRGDESGNDAW